MYLATNAVMNIVAFLNNRKAHVFKAVNVQINPSIDMLLEGFGTYFELPIRANKDMVSPIAATLIVEAFDQDNPDSIVISIWTERMGGTAKDTGRVALHECMNWEQAFYFISDLICPETQDLDAPIEF